MSDHWLLPQEKERAKDLEQASKFCENICNDFVSIASSSESAGKTEDWGLSSDILTLKFGSNMLGIKLYN